IYKIFKYPLMLLSTLLAFDESHEDIGTGPSVSFIIPVEGAKDTFVVGLGTSVALIKWSPSEPDNQIKKPIKMLSLDPSQAKRVKFNDAKCDIKGRLYAGNNLFTDA
ncbi:hypothetical protein Avbf_08029, partial [Armadillidium vulgare]